MSFTAPPAVTNCHTFLDPPERDVLYRRPLIFRYKCALGYKLSYHHYRQQIATCGIDDSGAYNETKPKFPS